MRGNEGLARVGGIVALLGAFYTATYITSYPGGAPAYAILGLLAGTAGGVVAYVRPGSVPLLRLSAALVGFGFSGAVIQSGIAFGPGFAVLLAAAIRGGHVVHVPHGEVFTGVARTPLPPWTAEDRGGQEAVVRVPEADAVVVVPDAEAQDSVSVSTN